jgi:hypothetical protein
MLKVSTREPRRCAAASLVLGGRNKVVEADETVVGGKAKNAWPRFERFICEIAKAGPQHRKAKAKTKTARSSKKRKGTKD